MKKIISYIMACCICFSAFSMSVFAETTDNSWNGTLESITESYDDAFIYYLDCSDCSDADIFSKKALVITPDGASDIYYDQKTIITVKVKEGKTFPIDEINAEIGQYGIENGPVISKNPDIDNQYDIYVKDDSRTKVYEILQKYDAVESITEHKAVRGMRGGWECSGVLINSKNVVSDEDIISKYPGLGLTADRREQTYGEEGYTYFSFTSNLNTGTVQKYRDLKKLFSDYSDTILPLSVCLLFPAECSAKDTVIYKAESAESDINSDKINDKVGNADISAGDLSGDKTVDMEDLIMLSQYLLGDIKLADSQLSIADCNGDSDVDIGDLATLKQYIMGDDIKLGK